MWVKAGVMSGAMKGEHVGPFIILSGCGSGS